ncbi:DUF1501 domain-containing protein [Aurantiacibacter sp. D1-12]|uniref:DUF1501 domain-containing protein n=1 Tax=Aurantiacibacter sp. D1-12 TaxID=2993658 RepID=UPI00237C95B2|nr:DUF1501 domain-containing protein [Aurantiacibacter sp. D1-12]MDE1468545.1 DUF1501 domain-containing protein [Aurantiacibacter sp. D1-12]
MILPISRRRLIVSSAIAAAGISFPSIAFGQEHQKRLVYIIQRGAADGLALLQPHGDPALRDLRGALVDDDAHDIDGFFALHPALARTAQLMRQGEGRGFHAVATRYRERSHFDGQNILETGASQPYGLRTGWLGRLLPLLPDSPGPMAMAPTVPLSMRGEIPVATYSTDRLPDPSDDLLLQLTTLYEEDAQLAPLWGEALRTRMLASDIGGDNGRNGGDVGLLAAQLMTAAGGPRVLMIETGGWDTHQAQRGRLGNQLTGLDSLLGALRDGLAGAWQDTLVILATEFGRTARVNGTQGTDHGTASAALMLGGGLEAGPPVVADWPGLADGQLYQNRDLRPTADLLELSTRAVADHFGIDRDRALAALRA